MAWLATYFVGKEAYLHFLKHDLTPQMPLWKDMLKIGLPAGAEFAMMAVYLMVVYTITRPFGAAAQAGFGIGMRVVQALFMPVVALGFSVAPVAGQNVGAKLGQRVKAVFKDASLMAGAWMLLMAMLCNITPTYIWIVRLEMRELDPSEYTWKPGELQTGGYLLLHCYSSGDEVERMMYGWSVLHCLPTQLVEDPSAALGTVMRADAVRGLAADAGFASLEVLPVDDELFRLYRLDA